MKNIAHRGFSSKFPENTMLSFQKAIEISADWIELDVTLSKDNIPVVIHDDTLDRTSNGKGLVQKYSLKQLKTFDFGSWKNRRFAEEKIPTLEEVLKLIHNQSIHLNIEIKSSAYKKKDSSHSIERQVLFLVKKYKLMGRVVISSFEPKVLTRLRSLSTKIRLAYLIEPGYEKIMPDPISFVKEIKADSLNIHKSQIRSRLFQKIRAEKIPTYVYTVNTLVEFRKMIGLGIAGVFTNYPDRLKLILNSSESISK